MKYGLVANPKVRDVIDIAKRTMEILGPDVKISGDLASMLGIEGYNIKDLDVDILITIGGDGTILKALQMNDAPILGINAGLVGFLASADMDDLDEKLQRVKNGDYTIEERIRMQVSINEKRLLDCTNEGVIHTSHISKMRDFEILIDGDQAMCIRADGIIVSTSTGSTCYSLSVGGPIIDPKAEAFVIAPIAPFRLSARPIVVPAKSQIQIKPLKGKDCVLVLDGQEQIDVGPSDTVSFTMSEKPSRFIQFGKSFYQKVWENLTV